MVSRLPRHWIPLRFNTTPIFGRCARRQLVCPIPTGFATPSGKVELYSSVLDELGFNPLPYHRDGAATSTDYPYRILTGVREDAFFQTGQRNIRVLRRKSPRPKLFLHPKDAARESISDGDWARLETELGHATAQISIQESMKEGHVRVPHGWWCRELRGKDP